MEAHREAPNMERISTQPDLRLSRSDPEQDDNVLNQSPHSLDRPPDSAGLPIMVEDGSTGENEQPTPSNTFEDDLTTSAHEGRSSDETSGEITPTEDANAEAPAMLVEYLESLNIGYTSGDINHIYNQVIGSVDPRFSESSRSSTYINSDLLNESDDESLIEIGADVEVEEPPEPIALAEHDPDPDTILEMPPFEEYGEVVSIEDACIKVKIILKSAEQAQKLLDDYYMKRLLSKYGPWAKKRHPEIPIHTLTIEIDVENEVLPALKYYRRSIIPGNIRMLYCKVISQWLWTADGNHWDSANCYIATGGTYIGCRPNEQDLIALKKLNTGIIEGSNMFDVDKFPCIFCKDFPSHPSSIEYECEGDSYTPLEPILIFIDWETKEDGKKQSEAPVSLPAFCWDVCDDETTIAVTLLGTLPYFDPILEDQECMPLLNHTIQELIKNPRDRRKAQLVDTILAHQNSNGFVTDKSNENCLHYITKALLDPKISCNEISGQYLDMFEHLLTDWDEDKLSNPVTDIFSTIIDWKPLLKQEEIYLSMIGSAITLNAISKSWGSIDSSLMELCIKHVLKHKYVHKILQYITTSDNFKVLKHAASALLISYPEKKSHRGYIGKYLLNIVSNKHFDTNASMNNEGQTIAHMCAKKRVVWILSKLCQDITFKPNLVDKKGQTVLFYIVEYLSLEDIHPFITSYGINWDYLVKDHAERCVLDHYRHVEGHDPYILEILTTKSRNSDEIEGVLPDLIPIKHFKKKTSGHKIHVDDIKLSTPKIEMCSPFQTDMMYDMRGTPKGRALIIAITEFKMNSGLASRKTYLKDSLRLGTLLDSMGFQVDTLSTASDTSINSSGLLKTIEKFGSSLTPQSQCIILCIMSHGSDGHIYTDDGSTVAVNDIFGIFSNKRCPQMSGKPKLFLIQACRGVKYDSGLKITKSNSKVNLETDAANDHDPTPERLWPLMSDMLIAYATTQGYVSYTNVEDGSIFINEFTKCLAEHAHNMDICSILTKVNRNMAEMCLTMGNGIAKQMPVFHSSLTKPFFFFPESYENVMKDCGHSQVDQGLK